MISAPFQEAQYQNGSAAQDVSHGMLQSYWLRQLTLRFGLVAAAVVLMSSIDAVRQSEMVGFTLPIWIEMAEYVLVFSLLVLAARQRVSARMGLLILATLLVVVGNRVLYQAVSQYKGGGIWAGDIYLYTEYAAYLVRNGVNPYAYDMADAYRAFRGHQIFITPLLQHDLHGALSYPPLSFLALIPFQLLGIPSNYTYIVVLVLSLLLIYRATPIPLRPVILLPFFISTDFIVFTFDGVSDIIWVFLMLVMILDWKQEKRRALWFGLICAYKQQPWLLAPFLLIRIWHECAGCSLRTRLRALATFTGITALVFFVINLPFMASDFPAWFRGVSDNFRDGIIIVGVGLSRLTEQGVVLMSKSVYSMLMLLAFGVSIALYWRHFHRWREAMWILPGIAFWFGYRGLTHYWLFWLFPLVLALGRSVIFTVEVEERKLRRKLSPKLSYALLGATALVIIGAVVWYGTRTNPVSIRIDGPIYASGDYVNRLNVIVTNNSGRELTPRFSVRSRYLTQPYFWEIVDGPATVAPGATARYTIRAMWPAIDFYYRAGFTSAWPLWDFYYRDGAQVIVSDAAGYDLRAMTFVPTDFPAAYPGVIPNGNFVFWRQDQHAPNYWGVIADPENPDAVQRVDTDQNRYHLRFMIPDATRAEWSFVKLDTQLVFPETPIQLWVKPPEQANHLSDLNMVYGLELIALDQRVWVLFGDEAAHGELGPGLYYWMTPAPRDVWSQQTLNVRQVFEDLGIEIRDMEQQQVWRFEQYNYPKTNLVFRLLFAARNRAAGWQTADFGPVANTSLLPDRNTMVQMAIEHPERILIWRGEQNRLNRNLEAAEAYFSRALDIAPDEARAHIGMGWTLFDEGENESAYARFEQARQLLDEQSEAYPLSDVGETYYGQAYVLLRQGRCGEATSAFERATVYSSQFTIPADYADLCGDLPAAIHGGG